MIYLDNAATTPAGKAALDAFYKTAAEDWGNPSALHSRGRRSAELLEQARAGLLKAAGGRDNYNLLFTSGGTESNNFALQGIADKHRGARIIVSAAEHSSVAVCAAFLKNKGYDVVSVAFGGSDAAFLRNLEAALSENTALVSVMSVNNETGLIFPIAQAVKLVKSRCPNAVFHTDAVQAFGKIPFSLDALGVDLASVGGHKLHAPVGIGGLFVRDGVKLTPRFYGGHQQGDLRPGTEPVALAAAFCAAAEDMCENLEANRAAAFEFRKTLIENSPDCVKFNLPENGSPFITSLALPAVPSEVLMRFAEESGIYISAGAACSKGKTSAAAKDLIGANSAYTVRVSVGAYAMRNAMCEDAQRVAQRDAYELAKLLTAARERFKLQIKKG